MEINKQRSTVRSSASEAIIDQGLRSYMLKVYNYMASGVCLLYTSPSPRDRTRSRMPSSA